MRHESTKHFDRWMAAALLIAVMGAAYAAVVSPIADRVQKTRYDIVEQRTLLGRLHAELNSATSGTETQTNANAARGTYFLPGNSAAIRAANLQARLGALVADANVAILSARAVPPENRDGLPFDGVEISFRATDAQLQNLLTAIERDRPFLFVDGLQLTQAPAEADVDRNADSQNDVTLRILGVVEQKAG